MVIAKLLILPIHCIAIDRLQSITGYRAWLSFAETITYQMVLPYYVRENQAAKKPEPSVDPAYDRYAYAVHCSTEMQGPPLRSTVVRASAQGEGGAGVRIPTASHQRRKNWEVCASQLGAWP